MVVSGGGRGLFEWKYRGMVKWVGMSGDVKLRRDSTSVRRGGGPEKTLANIFISFGQV